MSRIYLDVDDVLADFKGGAIERGVPRWEGTFYTNHPDTWTPEQRRISSMCDDLCNDESFWLGLPVAPRAFEILAAASMRRDTILLTAFPKGDVDRRMVFRAKTEWITRKLHVPESRIIICDRSDKALCARQRDSRGMLLSVNTLIDDAERNVAEWRAAGGSAYRHTPGHEEMTLEFLRNL